MDPTGPTPLLRRRLLRWYQRHGRAALPWRTIRSPYRTLVSEFMLAQTQVDRVVPKFQGFVERFPDFASLARASRADVLREWKGLGYNSRAVRLHRLARQVVEEYGGELPSESEALRALPGIGLYTLAAIRAFAFNLEEVPLDTNLRRIVHRLWLGVEHPARATARELGERARELLPPGRSHDWNSALMDLGASICTARAPSCPVCPLRAGCAAAPIERAALEAARIAGAKRTAPQAAIAFERSRRYARGRIIDRLRDLPPGHRISLLDLHATTPVFSDRTLEEVRELVAALDRDGLVSNDGNRIALRE
jgi:A/G-specific adenine glycosylase